MNQEQESTGLPTGYEERKSAGLPTVNQVCWMGLGTRLGVFGAWGIGVSLRLDDWVEDWRLGNRRLGDTGVGVGRELAKPGLGPAHWEAG